LATGSVDFFTDTGGYGFIETDEADEDVFFHMEAFGGPDSRRARRSSSRSSRPTRAPARRTARGCSRSRRVDASGPSRRPTRRG
jgi:hypothetical protein